MRAIARSLHGIGAAVRSRPRLFAGTWGLALFWFSLDNSFGLEWGFTVTTWDFARFAFLSTLVALYFARWIERRARFAVAARGRRAGGSGGVLGALGGVFGLSTGGCTVMGCGAPILPVIGLAFVGLSSTTTTWLSELSTIATAAVLIELASAVAWLGWRVGGPRAARPAWSHPLDVRCKLGA